MPGKPEVDKTTDSVDRPTRRKGSFNRRHFLTATGATALAAGGGLALAETLVGDHASALPAHPASARGLASRPFDAQRPTTAGTTLRTVSAKPSGGGYRRLRPGPAWPLAVRTDLAGARPGRDRRRRNLACFVQFTDLHIVDVQSPMRHEWMRAETASAPSTAPPPWSSGSTRSAAVPTPAARWAS